MARRKNYELRTTNFDFRRARVRGSVDNGKTWKIRSIYDLAYYLEHIDYEKYQYCGEMYVYQTLKDMLLTELKEAKYPNVKLITNEEE